VPGEAGLVAAGSGRGDPPEVVVVVVAVPPLAIVFAGVVELVVAVARARYHVPPKATIFSP